MILLNQINVPNTNIILFEDAIIILDSYPDIRWILNYGWYRNNQQLIKDWHLISISDATIMPIQPEDLENITIISNGTNSIQPPLPPQPEWIDILEE